MPWKVLFPNSVSAYLMPLLDSEIEAGKRLYDVNVFGVIAVTQAFFPLLKNARGTVANMGSIVGVGPLASYQCTDLPPRHLCGQT